MREPVSLEYEDEKSKRWIDDNIAIFKIKKGIFDSLTDLGRSDSNFSYFDRVEQDKEIQAVLLLNEEGSLGEKAYDRFVKNIFGKTGRRNLYQDVNFDKRTLRAREINILKRFILKAVELNKIILAGLNGTIVTPFFGVSLAFDFRFAARDTKFSLAHNEYGLHPGGALPFFLPRYVGRSKAIEILFNTREFSAKEAKETGLVNNIFPQDEFEIRCIQETKKICINTNTNVLRSTKPLINHFNKELEHYLEKESVFV
ncbi:enoyl-CoA hydratase/isomerase family protein [candidate division CSSED10-310 bacterium]|uniref:Enoyl-CoA hydratase/isomerase family protein n=1 Tax=candidate division CSSED10-310 bacterium TaxID=2855610 RepID=A0ABV6YV73_UNCC1